MMDTGESAEQMVYIMESGLRAFQQTETCTKLELQCEQAQRELEKKFDEEDYSFIMKRVEIFSLRLEREGAFLYQQAFKDCICLLKYFNILN